MDKEAVMSTIRFFSIWIEDRIESSDSILDSRLDRVGRFDSILIFAESNRADSIQIQLIRFDPYFEIESDRIGSDRKDREKYT